MKKRYIILLFTGVLSLSQALKAQNQKDLKEQYMVQAKEYIREEARVTAELTRKKYGVDNATETALFNMYFEQKMAVANTLSKYANTPKLKSELAAVITKNDSIADIYLEALKTKGLVNNKILRTEDLSKFAVAVRLRKQLALNDEQINSLMFHANKSHKLSVDSAEFLLKDYERKILPTILNDDQYLKVLRLENRNQALAWAKADWKEMNERGLATGLDSATVVRSIFNYDMATLVVRDRYGKNIPTNVALKSLETPMPDALQRLKTARKYKNPVPDKTANTNFTW